LKVDPALRVEMIKQWNQAVVWPFLVLPLLLLLLLWPAVSIWRKRQNLSIAHGFKPKSNVLEEEKR